jgi:RimJ/RimL family protein N-acetyltransferase
VSTAYEFRVGGHLDCHWTTLLAGLALTHGSDGTSTLTGPVADQAQLHGVLGRLRDVGAPLLAVRALPDNVGGVAAPLTDLGWPKRTERLTLRPARPDDAEATWRFRRLEPVCRWLTEVPTDLEFHRATFTDPARLATTLVIELDGEVIGDLMLRVEDAWSQKEVVDQARGRHAELGWVLDPGFVGHGYATEAVRELVRICFDELGLRRVTAICFADNEASWRLMERLGMRRELHAVADALHRSGEWLDTFGYAMLQHEWRGAPGVTRSE